MLVQGVLGVLAAPTGAAGRARLENFPLYCVGKIWVVGIKLLSSVAASVWTYGGSVGFGWSWLDVRWVCV